MNDSITRASELHKDHNFYDYVTFNFISFETEALNGWKNQVFYLYFTTAINYTLLGFFYRLII